MTRAFHIELSLVLKLHEIYERYGLRLTYKVRHGELYYEHKLIYRAGCITRLTKILLNYSDLYNDSHNRLFSKIEDLSPNLIKIKVRR